jgi:O-antigen ligase
LKDFKTYFWLITWPLLFTVIYTLVRHGNNGFTFASVNTMMKPFFRNHVNYAAMLSVWLPFVWLAWGWYKNKPWHRVILLVIGAAIATGLVLSYTRSSWLAVVAALAIAVVVRLRLMKVALIVGFGALVAGVWYMRDDNRFMDYAPNFDRTIYHSNLDAHLASTYKLEDISSAERVYRWVAGYKMWEANPLLGYGPGNFYNFYKSYTVNAFQTYVSDNPEKSTVHNYFLLLLVEQGIIGLLIFIVLTFVIFIHAEKLYHRVTDKQDRRWVIAIVMSLAAIYVNNMLSDLIETDKVGSLYFINIAMLMVLMHKYPSVETRREKRNVVVE